MGVFFLADCTCDTEERDKNNSRRKLNIVNGLQKTRKDEKGENIGENQWETELRESGSLVREYANRVATPINLSYLSDLFPGEVNPRRVATKAFTVRYRRGCNMCSQ